MAKLRQLMKTGAGALGSTSQEEVQKLATRQGRSAAPIQPLETSTIGGTPDQAKMAGTPNQRLSAIRQSFDASSTQKGFARREQSSATGSSILKDTKQAQLDSILGLGELGGRVKSIALARFEKQQETAEQVEFNMDDLELDEVQTALIDKLRSGEKLDGEEMRQVAYAVLGEEASASMALTDLSKEIASRLGLDVGESAAAAVAGELKLSELSTEDYQAIGFESGEQLATALGLDGTAYESLTLNQMQDLIDAKQAAEFDKSRELRNELNDPNLTDARRNSIMRQLDAMGASGEQDVEREFASIERAIDDGRMIEFDGQSVDVNRLLEDEYISAKVALALGDEAEMDRLLDEEPEFAEFIQEHQQAFENMVEDIDAGTKEFIEIQEEEQSKARPDSEMSVSLSDDTMKLFNGTWGDMVSEVSSDNGLVRFLKDETIDADTKDTLVSVLNEFTTNGDDDLVMEIGSMTPEQLKQVGLTSPESIEKWRTANDEYRVLEDVDTSDAGAFATQYLGATPEKLGDWLKEMKMLRDTGFRSREQSDTMRLLDADRDGRLDPISVIRDRMLVNSPRGGSLKALLSRGKTVGDLTTPSVSGTDLAKETEEDSPIYAQLRDYVSDGKVSFKELQKIQGSLDSKQLEELYKHGAPAMKPHQETLKRWLNDKANTRASDHFNYWTNNGPYAEHLKNANITDTGSLMRAANSAFESVRKARQTNPNANLGNPMYAEMFKFISSRGGLPTDNSFDKASMGKLNKELQKIADYISSGTSPASQDKNWRPDKILRDFM